MSDVFGLFTSFLDLLNIKRDKKLMAKGEYMRNWVFGIIVIVNIIIGFIISLDVDLSNISQKFKDLSLAFLILSVLAIFLFPKLASSYIFYSLPTIILTSYILCGDVNNSVESIKGIKVLQTISIVSLSLASVATFYTSYKKHYQKKSISKDLSTNVIVNPMESLESLLLRGYKGGYKASKDKYGGTGWGW